MQKTFYCALHVDPADQREILAYDPDPEVALAYAAVKHGIVESQTITVQATRRLSEMLDFLNCPTCFRITPNDQVDVVTFEELAYRPATPASGLEDEEAEKAKRAGNEGE
jgi:hypothetical protein